MSLLGVLALGGCTWAGAGGGTGEGTVTVAIVANPQMRDIQKFTGEFEREHPGIKVRYVTLPENEARARITQDVATKAGQFDVVMIGTYEAPIWGRNGWLTDLSKYARDDRAYDLNDLMPAVRKGLSADGKLYAVPFYGESSFLMYRKDVLAAKGIQMPAKPTWQQVADIAAKVDHAQPGMAGICLRGQPGWGQVFAPLTTVVNTFGGTWFTKDWQAQVDSDAFRRGTQFYVNLVRSHGENGAPQAGFTECLNNLIQGKSAMWYDATSATGSLEAADSPVRGKIGYAPAPVVETKNSGWLYAWAWAIQQASKKKDKAWKFISWASSKQYEDLVGTQLGWSRVPAGKRASTYTNPQYLKEASA
ncbi:MAG TPA: sugar ABC transporter substrate-binding protein, partial [Chloroflexota bacterium]|nr:sugar ABC transporter substrate-binding protein [Chloroflexota bacterium]